MPGLLVGKDLVLCSEHTGEPWKGFEQRGTGSDLGWSTGVESTGWEPREKARVGGEAGQERIRKLVDGQRGQRSEQGWKAAEARA